MTHVSDATISMFHAVQILMHYWQQTEGVMVQIHLLNVMEYVCLDIISQTNTSYAIRVQTLFKGNEVISFTEHDQKP